MQTLGEKLQEARQRLGVTLREAAEFTKLRTDYLQAMEANQFESIPLADVYRRGFVKVYARYLRLDDEKACADYNAYHSARVVRRPLDVATEEESTFQAPVAPVSAPMSRDTIIWGVMGIAIFALVILVLFM
ncbi:MAG: helix-turn-helix domain-containing protein [bacterium]|jgi:cytoskeletal protein RodZ